jgi:hypothetical protein
MVRDSELDELRRETEQMSRFAIEEPKPAAPPRAEPEAAPAQSAARPAAEP